MLKAAFLLIKRAEHLCKGKPSVTAGRKAEGSHASETAQLPEVRRAQPEREHFAPFTSGSRAHDVGRANTLQGKLWGVLFFAQPRSAQSSVLADRRRCARRPCGAQATAASM